MKLNDVSTVVVGMGYVGLTYAVHIAGKNFRVLGIEKDEKTRNAINNGVLPFFEEGLGEKLEKCVSNNLLFVISPEELVSWRIESKVKSLNFIITVGTPVRNECLDFTALNEVFSNLRQNLGPDDSVILRSTVSVGTTRKYCSELPYNIKYCFAPERTIEGKALLELQELPQVFGTDSTESALYFEKYFTGFHSEVILVSNPETAELVKLTSNVFRDVTFAFANEIAQVSFDHGVNSKEVINVANYKYPRCNIPFSGPVSGPCLTKDSYILNVSNPERSIIRSGRRLNEHYVKGIVDRLWDDRFVKICILGLAFKGSPPTSDMRDSLSIQIAKDLRCKNVEVYGYDPLVYNEDFEKNEIKKVESYESIFATFDLVIVQNNNPAFARHDWSRLSINPNGITIIDFWSIIPKYSHELVKLYHI
jgi:hypothetical protein